MAISVMLYVDGSFSTDDMMHTHGGALVVVPKQPLALYAQRYTTSRADLVSMRNVGGELMAAVSGIKLACSTCSAASPQGDNVEAEVTICYDYKGIKNFVDGPERWQPKKYGAVLYASTYAKIREMYPNIKFNFVKVKAHSGNYWNEVVDHLAKGDDVSSSVRVVFPTFTFN